jgi:hypothetical protein
LKAESSARILPPPSLPGLWPSPSGVELPAAALASPYAPSSPVGPPSFSTRPSPPGVSSAGVSASGCIPPSMGEGRSCECFCIIPVAWDFAPFWSGVSEST